MQGIVFPLDHICCDLSFSNPDKQSVIFFFPTIIWSQDAEDECGSQLFAEERPTNRNTLSFGRRRLFMFTSFSQS